MALFSKHKTASDILKLIAELPEDEKKALLDTLANESDDAEEAVEATEEEAEAAEEAADAEEALEDAEDAAEEAEEAEESEETEAEVEDEEPFEEGEENLPEETEVEEEAAESADAAEEADTQQERDFGAELTKLEEAVTALSNRLDAMESKAPAQSDEDEVGQAFGPDITNPGKTEDDELERARREAFGF